MFRRKHLVVAAVMAGAMGVAGTAYAFGPGPMGYGPGAFWPHGGLGILWLALLAIGIFWLVRTMTSQRRPPVRDTALEELRRQYAAGKIDHDDFVLRKTNLTGE